MYKIFSLTILTTITVALPHDFTSKADIPVHANFPMPILPSDF